MHRGISGRHYVDAISAKGEIRRVIAPGLGISSERSCPRARLPRVEIKDPEK